MKTIKFYIGTIQWKIGEAIYKLGSYITKKGIITLNKGLNTRAKIRYAELVKSGKVFEPFKDASNCGKEIVTIIQEGKLGPIYRN